MSIYTSSVVAPHGIEHPASGLRDIVHGCGLAALTPIDLNCTLSEQGVQEEDIDWMTENCFQVSAMMLQNHPCKLTPDDVRAIYRAAL